MRISWIVLLVLSLLVSCDKPPLEAYREATGARFATISLGKDSRGVDCHAQKDVTNRVMFYCGDVRNASGRVTWEHLAHGDSAESLAKAGPWRASINAEFTCQSPHATQIHGISVARLDCKRNIGDAPRIALVTIQGDRAYFADGDLTAFEPLQRALDISLGKVAPETAATAPVDPALVTDREVSDAIASGEGANTYDDLIYAGGRANLTENFSESAKAYGLAADLLKQHRPGSNEAQYPTEAADPLMREALQFSNMGDYPDADKVFDQAQKLIQQAMDSWKLGGTPLDNSLLPNLELYRALDLLNRSQPQDAFDDAQTQVRKNAAKQNQEQLVHAIGLLKDAEAKFRRYASPDELAELQTTAPIAEGGPGDPISKALYRELGDARAVLGVIAVKRSLALAYKMEGDLAASLQASMAATRLTAAQGLAYAQLNARNMRTTAMIYAAKARVEFADEHGAPPVQAEHDELTAMRLLDVSTIAFDKAYANSRPDAKTDLLFADEAFRLSNEQLRQGNLEVGLTMCRRAVEILKRLKTHGGVNAALLMPCLDALYGQKAYGEMFEAAQLAQSNLTSAQLAEAAAKLAESAKPGVKAAFAKREALNTEMERANQTLETNGNSAAAEQQFRNAERDQQSADAALEHLVPNIGLVELLVVSPKEVFDALGKDDTLTAIVLGDDHGWVFVLHRPHTLQITRLDGGLPKMQKLVGKIRATMEPDDNGNLPTFDSADAAELYRDIFGGETSLMHQTKRLIVAPSGPLLSLPFALLLTGPAGSDLAQAPWLIRDMTVEHVPSPANFVALHRLKPSKADKSWIGFGNPQPATQAQVTKVYPGPGCSNTVSMLSHFPPLGGTVGELDQARQILNGAPADEYLGPAFTLHAVAQPTLSDYKIVHFATHGVLPTDLNCVKEAEIIASAPANAADASDAFITASEVEHLEMDADAAVLSACNSGGANGETGGESLSGLARAFFYAGARSLLVTHWDVNDQVIRILVAGTLQHFKDDPDQGLAGALVAEQKAILHDATGPNAVFAHPYFWAPLALIGNGGVHYNN